MLLPWDNGNLVRIVGFFEQVVKVSHHLLKWIGHQVQRPICMDHGIFFVLTKIILGDNSIGELAIIAGECSDGGSAGIATSSPPGSSLQESGGSTWSKHCYTVILRGLDNKDMALQGQQRRERIMQSLSKKLNKDDVG